MFSVRWTVVVLLTACATAPSIARYEPPVEDMFTPESSGRLLGAQRAGPAEWLSRAAAEQLRRTVRVLPHRGFRWHLGSEVPVTADEEPGRTRPEWFRVIEELETAVRVRVESDGVRFLVWVQRDALHPVVLADTRLDVPGTVDPDSPMVVLRTGAAVDVQDDQNGRMSIELFHDDFDTAGTVPAAAVGYVFEREEEPAPEHLPDTPWLESYAQVRAEPTPSAPAVLTVEGTHVQLVGTPIDGWQEIEMDSFYVYARGFVRTEEIGAVAAARPVRGLAPLSSSPRRAELGVGACLYDRPGGAVVGVEAARIARGVRPADMPGWSWITIGTPWGPVDVAAEADRGGWKRCLPERMI